MCKVQGSTAVVLAGRGKRTVLQLSQLVYIESSRPARAAQQCPASLGRFGRAGGQKRGLEMIRYIVYMYSKSPFIL